jgi:hypothetical protein
MRAHGVTYGTRRPPSTRPKAMRCDNSRFVVLNVISIVGSIVVAYVQSHPVRPYFCVGYVGIIRQENARNDKRNMMSILCHKVTALMVVTGASLPRTKRGVSM